MGSYWGNFKIRLEKQTNIDTLYIRVQFVRLQSVHLALITIHVSTILLNVFVLSGWLVTMYTLYIEWAKCQTPMLKHVITGRRCLLRHWTFHFNPLSADFPEQNINILSLFLFYIIDIIINAIIIMLSHWYNTSSWCLLRWKTIMCLCYTHIYIFICIYIYIVNTWCHRAVRSQGIRSFCMMTSSNGNISALLALCDGNSPVTGLFPLQSPVTRSFYVLFNLRSE